MRPGTTPIPSLRHVGSRATWPFGAAWKKSLSGCGLIGLELLQRQAHPEAGGTGLRADADMAAVFADDAHGIVESQPEALARRLCREEWLKDPVLQIGGDAWASIPNLNKQHIGLKAASEAQLALVAQGVERVFDQGCPDLV